MCSLNCCEGKLASFADADMQVDMAVHSLNIPRLIVCVRIACWGLIRVFFFGLNEVRSYCGSLPGCSLLHLVLFLFILLSLLPLDSAIQGKPRCNCSVWSSSSLVCVSLPFPHNLFIHFTIKAPFLKVWMCTSLSFTVLSRDISLQTR